eukprot:TRINITY_DN6423_c0_g1_i11.p1 TRINITY_DN6423_c0_g1~~TRINITY_DN6423_c0_g1_i11.p1  ORF type:complete len:236 (-),score=18.24 TRINITY_DN6423_c0_g1_i11:11-718(-)
MSTGQNNLFQFFLTLITQPSTLVNTYFPVQPEDVQAMAVRVLGGRWYKCPNMHSYYVDKCGRPTEVNKCATCGVEIGGTDHNLLDTNKDLDDKLQGNTGYHQKSAALDKSETNYCGRTPEEEKNPFDVVRGLTPTSTRTLRFLLHSAFVLGSIGGGDRWSKQIGTVINKSYSNPKDPSLFFTEHLQSDWKVLGTMVRRSVDDVAMLLHLSILSIEQIGRAVQQECRDRSRMPSSA